MKRLLCLLFLPTLAIAQPAAREVKVVEPSPAKEAQRFSLPGRTEPWESARLATRATGVISERRFDIGDAVQEGEVVALVDAPEIDHAVEAARAALAQAEARLRNAKQLAERAARLHGERAVSREEFESRSAGAEEVDAAVRQARAELARLEAQQGFATVRAPFAGVVAARNFDRGDHVRGDAGQSWLYQIVRLDPLRFSVHASPDVALQLTPESEAQIAFREFPGRTFAAKVARSSRVFDTASGTMRVELLVENPKGELPAGLTGTATFRLPARKETFLIPTNALLIREGKPQVAVVGEGSKAAFVEVLPGRNLGTQVEVTSPSLGVQSRIIVNPNAMLRAGDAVTTSPREE